MPPGQRATQLQQLHVAVLPERCGTHSRDLEVCRDVGTRVVAPGCGFFADQWSEVVTYGNDEVDGMEALGLNGRVIADDPKSKRVVGMMRVRRARAIGKLGDASGALRELALAR